MSGFPKDNWILKHASDFSLWHYIGLVQVCGENMATNRYVVGKECFNSVLSELWIFFDSSLKFVSEIVLKATTVKCNLKVYQ